MTFRDYIHARPGRPRTNAMNPLERVRQCVSRLRWFFGVGLIIQSVATTAGAQTSREPAVQGRDRDMAGHSSSTSAAQLAALPGLPVTAGDTGRMQHGWRDFSRYSWMPGMCVRAALNVRDGLWGLQKGRRDTIRYAVSQQEALPAQMYTVAQQCDSTSDNEWMARIDRGMSSADFIAAVRMAIVRGNDRLALQMLDRHLAHVTEPDIYRGIYNQFNSIVLNKSRVRRQNRMHIALATTLRNRFDSLGATDATVWIQDWRAQFHHAVVAHWLRMGDTAKAHSEMEYSLRQFRTAPPAIRTLLLSKKLNRISLTRWFEVLREWTALQYGWNSPEMIQEIERHDQELRVLGVIKTSATMGVKLLDLHMPLLTLIGSRWQPPRTPYWFPPPQDNSGKATQISHTQSESFPGPRPGRATLVIWAVTTCLENPKPWPERTNCHITYAAVRRLLQKYGPKGLDLIIVSKTQGYVPGGSLLESEKEAEAIRAYFQDYWKLPATVIVQTSTYDTRPEPDGRRRRRRTKYELAYGATESTFPYAMRREGENSDQTSGNNDTEATFNLVESGLRGFRDFVLDREGNILAVDPAVGIGHFTDDDTPETILELYIRKALQ